MHTINLMPVELRRRRFLLDRGRIWGAIGGVIIVGLVGGQFLLSGRVAGARAALAVDDETPEQLAGAKAEVERLKERQETFRQKQLVMERLVRGREWEMVIREVSGLVGDGIWLTELRLSSTLLQSPASAATDAGSAGEEHKNLRIAGYAISNSEFAACVSRLGRCRRLTDIEPAEARRNKFEGGELVEFSIAAKVVVGDGAETGARASVENEEGIWLVGARASERGLAP